jgi:ABC-type glycerol-3-phosphate transport system substrate-binding protein
MTNKFFKLTTLFLLLTFLITSGASCSKGGTQEAKDAYKPITLKFWSVYDDSDAYEAIIADYRRIHPNVTIEYRKLLYSEYQDALVKAFALDEGPDIFSVHNTWIRKYQDFASPMPTSVSLPFKTVIGTVQKEEVIELRDQTMYTVNQIKSLFGDTVAQDAVLPLSNTNRVYGVPMSLDTLALYYNKDILNNAGIAEPAQYWTEAQAQVEKIRKFDDNQNILLAAIPLGTGKNVTRNFDILSLLMMQLKTNMTDGAGRITFNAMPAALAEKELTQPPGINALDFYTSFADPLVTTYTWNNKMPESLDAFINGQTAYFIGYAYHRPVIEARAPKLNYAIAPMLQIQGYDKVNYANYWLNTVANKSKNKDWAWDFIRFASTKDEAVKYLDATRKPTALRSLYDTELAKENRAVFVEQTLTAKTWYRGRDAEAAEDIFVQMIDNALINKSKLTDIAKTAVQKIQQTW